MPSVLKASSLPRHRATTPTDNALEWAMRRCVCVLEALCCVCSACMHWPAHAFVQAVFGASNGG